MALPELSPELWTLIFEFCLEKGEPGRFVPQNTLAAALRVDKTFFELAGAVLYRNPVVHNIRNFLQGAYEDTRAAQDKLERIQTKLPLLKHVRRLALVPQIHRSGTSTSVPCAAGLDSKAQELVFNGVVVTPSLKALTIGYDKERFTLKEVAHPLCSNSQSNVIGPLMAITSPDTVCTYPKDTSVDIPNETGAGWPSVHNIHMSYLDPEWCLDLPIVLGTTNRISVTEELDKHCRAWPLRVLTQALNTTSTAEQSSWTTSDWTWAHRPDLLVSSEEMAGFDSTDYHQCTRYLSDEESLINFLSVTVREVYDEYNGRLLYDMGRGRMRQITTILEFYGLEKFLPLSEAITTFAATHLGSASDEAPRQIDLSSWSAYRDSRHSSAYLAIREEVQRATLKRIQDAVETCLEEIIKPFDCQPLIIRLRLGSDYEGCGSCGEGKGDKWTLDHRHPISEARIRRRFEPGVRDLARESAELDDHNEDSYDDDDYDSEVDEYYNDLGIYGYEDHDDGFYMSDGSGDWDGGEWL
ncbi:hypothetical protein IAU59_002463 [Kwoniella sp. CBS 9459]